MHALIRYILIVIIKTCTFQVMLILNLDNIINGYEFFYDLYT